VVKDADKQPWIAWLCAAPMPVIGVAVGLYLCRISFDRYVAAVQAEFPGADLCGNPIIGCIIFGLLGGSLGGIVAGAAIAKLVTRFVHRHGRLNPGKDTASDEEDLTPSSGPAEARWKEIRAEIDLVGNVMERAGEQGDEEVLSKLTDYRAGLEQELGY
jgi:hypothetical protein